MKHAILELVGLAVRNIDQVHPSQQADMLEAAAEILQQGHSIERADKCRAAAAMMREAEQARVDLTAAFKS